MNKIGDRYHFLCVFYSRIHKLYNVNWKNKKTHMSSYDPILYFWGLNEYISYLIGSYKGFNKIVL